MTSFYMYLDKTGSLDYFPKNNGKDFIVKLPERINFLHGTWLCGLVQACFSHDNKSQGIVYVGSDIIENSSITCNGSFPILRSITCSKLNKTCGTQIVSDMFSDVQSLTTSTIQQIEFHNILYIPVRVKSFEQVNIYLRDKSWSNIVQSIELHDCLLHFKLSM